jgi:hypothetical protein
MTWPRPDCRATASESSMIDLWERVDELVSPARSLRDLRAHHLQFLAADYWRRTGFPVPEDLLLEERNLALRQLAADVLLRKVRDAVTGTLVVFKGPEAAAHYPLPGLRPFGDIDLLVPKPEEAHRVLLSAGFVATGNTEDYYAGLHHVQPLRWPTLPLSVELHHYPNWVDWTVPPSAAQLFRDLVPARAGPPGVSALDPTKHALVLAVNSWADVPMRRVLDLIDIAAVLESLDPSTVQPLADDWGVGRIWRTTTLAMNHMLVGAPRPASMRTWGRATASVRDMTVAEDHFRRLASVFWALPLHRAAGLFARRLVGELVPSDDESWRPKLRRTLFALRSPLRRRADHDRLLGDNAHRFSRSTKKGPIAREHKSSG